MATATDTSMNNDLNEHTICGDASVLIPPQFRAEFAKTQNVTAPLLLLDTNIFKQVFRDMKAALPEAKWQYAMKTNDNLGLIAIAIQEGHGLDCSSVGEIQRVHDVAIALSMDVSQVMARCSYGNPNKSTADIRRAHALGVSDFSLDDRQEIDKIALAAPGSSVYLRTFIDATQKTALSKFTNKFGAPLKDLVDLAEYAQSKGLKPYSVGLSVGGGQTDLEAFALGVETAATINKRCQDVGVPTMIGITFCGGLPAPSAPGAPTFKTIGDRIRSACTEFGIAPEDVTFEPGRSLGTTCGIIKAKVITLKEPKLGDGKWTLVLNIGVFKGLYEMERTNLTYKLSTYGRKDDLVPCRIVDDTCDSKGVCFKETIVMMPRSLVQGSDVFFHNTGSYTTAYVMDGFNRTDPLTSRCFPDPLAKVTLSKWLKNVATPGEAAHPNKDFKALKTTYLKIETAEEGDRFLIKNVPGSATLGIPLLPAHLRKYFRKLNTAIIQHTPDQPGDEHRISFQQQNLFENIPDGWIANSKFHSPNSWEDYSTLDCNGGATVYFCLQNQYRSNVNHCILMHASLVSDPEDKSDGSPQFIETNYNPYLLDGLDKTVIKRTFGQSLRNQMARDDDGNTVHEMVTRDPEGLFEQLMAGEKLLPEFANADLVWGGSLADTDPLSSYWPNATVKNGKTRPIDLEGALGFKLSTKQHSLFLRLLSFLGVSYAAGYGVSNPGHVDRNSCIYLTIRIIMFVKLGRDLHLGEDWSTDRLIEHLAKVADTCLWTDQAGHSIGDMKKFKRVAKKVEVEEFVANVQSLLCHPTMMQPHGGENAYNTTYMSDLMVPHPDYDAQQLYQLAANRALKLLEDKAFNMGAITERMEF